MDWECGKELPVDVDCEKLEHVDHSPSLLSLLSPPCFAPSIARGTSEARGHLVPIRRLAVHDVHRERELTD